VRSGVFFGCKYLLRDAPLGFDDTGLRSLVEHIAQTSGQLMEIVNFNVEAEQYVCAAHVCKTPFL
jgi:malonyl CoA-acyl carrier protein transacylase